MSLRLKITSLSVLLLMAAGVCAQAQEEALQAQDTARLRYPVQKTFSETQEDLRQVHPADLPQPDNLDMQVQYDADADRFYFTPSLGEESLSTPFYMTGDEYVDFSSRKSLSDYYRNRVKEEKGKKHELSLTDMKFDIGQADKIFGPGGVQLKLQGSAELISV